MNLRFGTEVEVLGFQRNGEHQVRNAEGYTITATFGRQDGFACWKYRTGTPAGKTLGDFPSALGAARWIERELAKAEVSHG
ncbi:hypothetical protein [Pseudomonas boanensis]|uniref:hypothetical protein n=1 Tax=Metapseudomonas boanensis TaxID=2822138 RepID=UPI0035D4172D